MNAHGGQVVLRCEDNSKASFVVLKFRGDKTLTYDSSFDIEINGWPDQATPNKDECRWEYPLDPPRTLDEIKIKVFAGKEGFTITETNRRVTKDRGKRDTNDSCAAHILFTIEKIKRDSDVSRLFNNYMKDKR